VDTVSHALLGALAGQAVSPEQGRLGARERMLLAGAAGAFPDVDFIAFPINPLLFLADWHQGLTHSLVLLPAWALCAAGVHVCITGHKQAFREAALLCALALASHIVADLITAYGTRLLAPLSAWRPSLDLTFVIDPLFTTIVLAGLVLSLCVRGSQVARRRIARLALVVLCGYVAGQGLLKGQAIDLAASFARNEGLEIDEIAALPQPFSPFNWTLIVRDGDRYHRAHVNLVGHKPLVPDVSGLGRLHEIAASYPPPGKLRWQSRYRYGQTEDQHLLAARLWRYPDFAPYRRFAVYPSLSRIDLRDGRTCVWFTDLRYDLPALPDTFRYGFCRDEPLQPWRLYRLRYLSHDARQAL
jgi:inner membrane protein